MLAIREAGLVVGITGVIRRALRRGWRRRCGSHGAEIACAAFASRAVCDRIVLAPR